MAGKYKELLIAHAPNSPLYCLRFAGGGELPNVLDTYYTSHREADKARALYYKGKLNKTKPVDDINKVA